MCIYCVVLVQLEATVQDGNKWRHKHSNFSFNDKSPLDALLTEKLNEVINEGILDSILPFICAANLPLQSDKLNVNHTCGLKTKTNTTTKLLSPRIVVNKDKDDGGASTSRSTNENLSNLAATSKERSHQRRKSVQSVGLTEYVKC